MNGLPALIRHYCEPGIINRPLKSLRPWIFAKIQVTLQVAVPPIELKINPTARILPYSFLSCVLSVFFHWRLALDQEFQAEA